MDRGRRFIVPRLVAQRYPFNYKLHGMPQWRQGENGLGQEENRRALLDWPLDLYSGPLVRTLGIYWFRFCWHNQSPFIEWATRTRARRKPRSNTNNHMRCALHTCPVQCQLVNKRRLLLALFLDHPQTLTQRLPDHAGTA